MCGRFYVNEGMRQELEEVFQTLGGHFKDLRTGTGDIHPSEKALVFMDREGLDAGRMNWGFSLPGEKRLIINARAESVLEKPLFRDSAFKRRCVIPAAGFYEWNRFKEIVSFYRADGKILYLAGIWNYFQDGERFTILTVRPNESVASVHNRMPLVLEQDEIGDWMSDNKKAGKLLSKIPAPLTRHQEYEQEQMVFL